MIEKPKPLAHTKLVPMYLRGEEGADIYELLNYYRLQAGMTWNKLFLSSLAYYIQNDNYLIGEAIRIYMKKYIDANRRGIPNTPRTHSPERRQSHSETMKKVWGVMREKQND